MSPTAETPLAVGERAPDFEALYCDGETFRPEHLRAVMGDRGTVLAFGGFAFSPPGRNWFRRYEWYGWTDHEGVAMVPVLRAGPYAANAFIRRLESPLAAFADVEGSAAEDYGLLTEREDMAGARTARRAVFVLDGEGVVRFAWVADRSDSPLPREAIDEAIDGL